MGKECMANIQRQLAVIWTNDPPYRYVPQATGDGGAWQVFDRKANRLLKNKEIAELTFEDCTEKLMH